MATEEKNQDRTGKEGVRVEMLRSQKKTILLAQAALMMALAYIGFQFMRIDINLPGGKTAFHFGNVFLVLGVLLIGSLWGGLAGALGMTIADLTSAGYAIYAPMTFVLKMGIAFFCGLLAHRVLKIRAQEDKKKLFRDCLISSAAGMIFNIFADPIVGYVYKRYLLGVPADPALILAKMSALTTMVNAVLAVAAATLIYVALRPALVKARLFPEN